MSEASGQPQDARDATAALQELEDQLAGGKGKPSSGIDAATAVAAAAATAAAEPPVAASPAPEPQKAEAHAAEPKKKKSRRVFFEGGPSRTLTALRKRLTELTQALSSPDYPTRRGARIFFASLAGLVLVMGVTAHRYWSHVKEMRAHAARATRKQNAVLAEFLRKRQEIAHRKNSTLLLGGFNVALQPELGRRPGSKGYRVAEVELVVECDSKEARDYLEERLAQARNEVTNTFVKVDREDLMTVEGKTRLKHSLQERLNLMLPKGRVEAVFFSKLVLT